MLLADAIIFACRVRQNVNILLAPTDENNAPCGGVSLLRLWWAIQDLNLRPRHYQ